MARPRNAGKEVDSRRPLADEPVAAVQRRPQHHVGLVEHSRYRLQMFRRHPRAVGTHDHHANLAFGEASPEGVGHAIAEIADVLELDEYIESTDPGP